MRLKDYISAHGMTHAQLAEAVGVTSEAIRRYCNGSRIPRPKVMKKISKATAQTVLPQDFYQ